jgi:hypothetical protein
MGQTPNIERRTPNTEWGEVSEFDVGRSMFGVRCFLHVLALQRIELIDTGRVVMTVNGDDECQANGCFGGGDGD